MIEGFFIDMLITKDIFCWIESCWGKISIAYDDPIWLALIEQAFRDKTAGFEGGQKYPFCVRLVGQSGAGKTSQLLPAVKKALRQNKKTFISFAVRDFVQYHPDLENISQNYGEAFLRERTNTFALILLTNVLLRCIAEKMPILLEVTLLSPIYEQYLHAAFVEKSYFCDYQCLAVPKNVSNDWIQKRFLATGRVVSNSSIDFFYSTLEPVFKFLQKTSLQNRVFVWDRVHAKPLISCLQDPELYNKIQSARALEGPFLSLESAIATKMIFLCDYYRSHGIAGIKNDRKEGL